MMKILQPCDLLGNISPQQFMKRHWQTRPLLVRGAVRDMESVLSRDELFEMAQQEEVSSRLMKINPRTQAWQLKHGPFRSQDLPAVGTPNWTLLVQGVDLLNERVAKILQYFRFVPDARLDDVMISYASQGGGVGPHFDSYDVFLLQAQGARRWRIGAQKDLRLQPQMPLKILANFSPTQEYILEPGDLLYLPPHYAHEGVALGPDCMTYSIGFRAPLSLDLAMDLLQRFEIDEESPQILFGDPEQKAVDHPAQIPISIQRFAKKSITQLLSDSDQMQRALGESLTEPKQQVCFQSQNCPKSLKRVELNSQSRMMYDDRFIFLNGESWYAKGRDAQMLKKLADQKYLELGDLQKAPEAAISLMRDWVKFGWLWAR